MLNVPFTLSMNPGAIQRPSPLLGQHTREILIDLAYTEDEIKTMVNSGVVKIA
jgi:crotonobetainyl-CoA:carnitine CoA-transferase CaiB-like acyl-CoA transferase